MPSSTGHIGPFFILVQSNENEGDKTFQTELFRKLIDPLAEQRSGI